MAAHLGPLHLLVQAHCSPARKAGDYGTFVIQLRLFPELAPPQVTMSCALGWSLPWAPQQEPSSQKCTARTAWEASDEDSVVGLSPGLPPWGRYSTLCRPICLLLEEEQRPACLHPQACPAPVTCVPLWDGHPTCTSGASEWRGSVRPGPAQQEEPPQASARHPP